MELNDLPNEILELIFASLPMMDTFKVCTLVCQRWHDVIWRREFIPWKKAYYRYKLLPDEYSFSAASNLDSKDDNDDDDGEPSRKKKRKSESENMDDKSYWKHHDLFKDLEKESFYISNTAIINPESILGNSADNILKSLQLVIPSLIKYTVEKFGKISKRFVQISKHPKFKSAESWLQKVMPDIHSNPHHEVGNVVALCAVANDAFDVKGIFEALQAPSIGSTCSSVDASELMYFIALAFIRFTRTIRLPSRFHFNVFQAIYFFENEFRATIKEKNSLVQSPRKGQQSLMNFGFSKIETSIKLTAEQLRIIRHPLDKTRNDIVKIVAFAGTGKTTTLIRLSKENPHLKFLVVMYNKSVREHAERVFPTNNVKCVTAHSIAFRKCGFMFAKKLTSNLKPIDILEADILTEDETGATNKLNRGSLQKRAAQVLKTIENFMNSTDMELTDENVPAYWSNPYMADDVAITSREKDYIFEHALKVWNAMIDPNNLKIRMPHDGYLKAYQLRRPNLQKIWSHDVLLIDEAQDMNPPMLDIFSSQSTPKVMVGDPNQQIYLFRGAVNALDTVKNVTHTYYLTQSFRFGPEIAFAANSFLEHHKKIDKQTLVGGQKKDEIISRSVADKTKDKSPVAIIGRTNLGLFAEVVKLICDVEPEKRPSAAFAGGFDSYNFSDYLDIYYLKAGQIERMKKWKKFKSFESFQQFASNTGDRELMSKIDVVKKYDSRLPLIIERIDRFCNADPRSCNYIFTTVHKAKGLEWNTVILLDDFMELSFVNPGKGSIPFGEDEKNLLYVAMTRAKKYLALNTAVLELLVSVFHTFERVTIGNREDLLYTTCVTCLDDQIGERKPFAFERSGFSITNNYSQCAGTICKFCAGIFKRMIIGDDTDLKSGLRFLFMDRTRMVLRYFVGPIGDEQLKKAKDIYNKEGTGHFLEMENFFDEEM